MTDSVEPRHCGNINTKASSRDRDNFAKFRLKTHLRYVASSPSPAFSSDSSVAPSTSMRRAALAPGPWGDGGLCRRDAADDEMAELNMDPHRFPT